MKEQKELFPYSTNQFIVITFLIYSSQRIFSNLNQLGRMSGLHFRSTENLVWGVGQFLNHYYAWHLLPLLMMLYILSKNVKFLNPSPKTSNFIHSFLTISCLLLMAYLTTNILDNGFYSYFKFLGYSVYNLGLLIYMPVALYLLDLFRHENIFKMLMVTLLGVQMVSDLWELPLNLVWHHNTHIYLYMLGTFQHLLIPLIFWFYSFRKNYLEAIKKQWYFMTSLILIATLLTIARLFFVTEGYPCYFVIMSLHVVYAFLIVFIPFHKS